MQTAAALALAKNDHALNFEPEVVRPKPDRPDRLLTTRKDYDRRRSSPKMLAPGWTMIGTGPRLGIGLGHRLVEALALALDEVRPIMIHPGGKHHRRGPARS